MFGVGKEKVAERSILFANGRWLDGVRTMPPSMTSLWQLMKYFTKL